DLVIVIAATVVCITVSALLDGSERLFSLTRRWEFLQIDEWPTAALVLAIGLIWMSWRRNREALRELRAREAAEHRLAEALVENRQFAQRHLLIQEAERKHLARELHDELGQYLNAIKLDAVGIGELSSADSSSRAAATRIVNAADHVHSAV